MTDDQVSTYIQIGSEMIDASAVTLPESGRRFRHAWIDQGEDAIGVDMDMARDIARNEIRTAREPKLRELDIQYQRATETRADTAEIVERKQRLRDAPGDPRIDEAEDDVALAEALDAILGEIEEV